MFDGRIRIELLNMPCLKHCVWRKLDWCLEGTIDVDDWIQRQARASDYVQARVVTWIGVSKDGYDASRERERRVYSFRRETCKPCASRIEPRAESEDNRVKNVTDEDMNG